MFAVFRASRQNVGRKIMKPLPFFKNLEKLEEN
jgi:hypothetical protein